MRDFIAELKRRRVLRVGAVWIVASLAVLQAAAVLAPALRLPDWTVSFVAFLAILGLPVAAALAWVYDLGPEGLRRTPPGPAPEAEPVSRSRVPAFAGVILLIALLAYGAYARFSGSGASSASAPISSIAVLPFEDLSPEGDQEYFSDGMSEEILNALLRIQGLNVAARTSSFAYRDRQQDVRTIGSELGVDAVLEGSVRKADDQVRITAQLIDTRTGFHRWSETFDRDLSDIFALQEEIAQAIVDALDLALAGGSGTRLVRSYTDNLEAYELYLKGRFEQERAFTGGGEAAALTAIERYQEALALDSTYALAWAGIAETYAWQLADNFWAPSRAYPEAREAAEKGLALDSELPDAHGVLGMIAFWFDWDLPAAERRLTKAIELDPRNARTRQILGSVYATQHRWRDAIQEFGTVVGLDHSRAEQPAFQSRLARARVRLGDTDPLIDSLSAAIRADTTDHQAITALFHVLLEARRFDLLAPVSDGMQSLVQLDTRNIWRAHFAAAEALLRRPAAAERLLAELRAASESAYVAPDLMAGLLAALGREEEALAELERAEELRSGYLVDFGLDWPEYDSIRDDPRFVALRRRIGLPEG